MAPIICIRIPDFALQILRLRTRAAEDLPLITVHDDRPAARVTACNHAATACGVRPGMRYAQALSLDYAIRAGVVSLQERGREMGDIEGMLLGLVPQVERSRFEEGVFWVPAGGLDRHVAGVYGEDRTLTRILVERIEGAGRRVSAAEGHSRAGSAVASALEQNIGFDRFEEEWEWMLRQTLTALPLPPKDADRLRFLGLRVIGDLVRLPEGQLRRRMSGRTAEIYRFLQEERRLPLYQQRERRRLSREYRFEYRITSSDRLLERIEPMLGELRDEATAAALWINAVTITIRGDMDEPWRQRISGGSATRDLAFLRRLVALRLESQAPSSAELSVMLIEADCVPGVEQQGELIAAETGDVPIDRRRLNDAILTLQAELGGEALVRILAADAVVPERRLRLVPVSTGGDLLWSSASETQPHPDGIRRVRRIETRWAEAAGTSGAQTATGSGATTSRAATGARSWGPFFLSSFWWTGMEIERIYRYRLGDDGTLLWEYLQPGMRRVSTQGRVE